MIKDLKRLLSSLWFLAMNYLQLGIDYLDLLHSDLTLKLENKRQSSKDDYPA